MNLRMSNLESQQTALVDLVLFSGNHGEIDLGNTEFLDLVAKAYVQQLSLQDLERLTELVQECTSLPVYTTTQAAAWAGVTIDGVRNAIWHTSPPLLKTFKPGHDVLVKHQDLVAYANARN